MASVIISPAARADRGSSSFSNALTRRECASSWRPSSCSTPAHAAVRATRAPGSSGSSSIPCSSAVRASAKWPVAASVPASAVSSSTRSSAGAESPSSRKAAANQRAAPAGVRCAASSPAARRTATAVVVALRGGALEVVRACRRRRAACRQRLGASLMGAETPAAGRGFVDRAADERVPEAKAARHICGTDEIAAQELVERLDRRRRVDARRRRHRLGLERVAGHRRSFEHPAGLPGEQRELLGERRGHRGRHLDAPDGRARG